MSVIDDAVLLKMAEHEILKEAKRAAARHSVIGVSGWQPCSKPNKRFLTNTLLQAMASNRIRARRKENQSLREKKIERKLLRSAVEKDSNFLYKKPKEIKNKPVLNTNSTKCKIKRNKSEDEQSKPTKEFKKQCSAINMKFKKV